MGSKFTKAYILNLAGLKDKVQASLNQIEMPSYIRNVLAANIGTLSEVTLTYPLEGGIAVPELEHQVLFEWLEMFLGYLPELYKIRSKRPDVRLFFGIDNSYFYGIFHTALFHVMGLDDILPKQFVSNSFLQLDGKKFSTSRRHAIWVEEILEVIEADTLRLYLANIRPEEKTENFTLKNFAQFIEYTLVKGVDRWLQTFPNPVSQSRIDRNPIEQSIFNALRDTDEYLKKEKFDVKKSAGTFILALELTKHLVSSENRSFSIETEIFLEFKSLLDIFMPNRLQNCEGLEELRANPFSNDLALLERFINATGDSK